MTKSQWKSLNCSMLVRQRSLPGTLIDEPKVAMDSPINRIAAGPPLAIDSYHAKTDQSTFLELCWMVYRVFRCISKIMRRTFENMKAHLYLPIGRALLGRQAVIRTLPLFLDLDSLLRRGIAKAWIVAPERRLAFIG